MRLVEDNDFIMGQFVWTGFDYLESPRLRLAGEKFIFRDSGPCRVPQKDSYYMYQSRWMPEKNVASSSSHWNWKEGQDVDVWACFNNADEVELFLNGESQGVRKPTERTTTYGGVSPFRPGELVAVSRKGGKEVMRDTVRTASEPYAIRLTPDRKEIAADGTDLSYISVEIVDKDGNLCPWAENLVEFKVEGPGFNAGVDNGSPISLEPFIGR